MKGVKWFTYVRVYENHKKIITLLNWIIHLRNNDGNFIFVYTLYLIKKYILNSCLVDIVIKKKQSLPNSILFEC